MLFMTVPTAGQHPGLLEDLIRNCGLPPEQIVIVVTRPDVHLPAGVVRVEDFGPLNIQRWWNKGIEEAQRRGATAVAVLNDDMWVTPTTLLELHQELTLSGAAVASPSRPGERVGLHKGSPIPYLPKIWGCFWLLRLDSGLRPDERYVWWYGDHDLDIRARRSHGGIVTKDVEWEHVHSGEGTGRSPELAAHADNDAETYAQDYARLITLSRWASAPSAFIQRLTSR